LLAYLTLGAFAGIRTEEILRMNWEDINWTDGHICILKPKKVTRWRPRHVEILPALRRHLEPFALKNGRIFPGGEPQLWALRNELVKLLGLQAWPSNCLRHSFATYHVPIQNDYSKLSIQMGHANANMTRYKYGALRPRTVAGQWWAL
jgi:integrase/recombinase XerD